MERMNREELLELIRQVGISSDEFVVLSSGALVLRGIYESAGDLDIAVTRKGLEELSSKYNLIPKPGHDNWYIVNDRVECVLDDMEGKKEKVGEYYLQDINDYLSYLESSEREKDKLRIPLVEEYIKGRSR